MGSQVIVARVSVAENLNTKFAGVLETQEKLKMVSSLPCSFYKNLMFDPLNEVNTVQV